LASAWPRGRLIEIWNSLPGDISVKKFTERKKAVAWIWKVIQSLVPTPEADRNKAPDHGGEGREYYPSDEVRRSCEGEAGQGHPSQEDRQTHHDPR